MYTIKEIENEIKTVGTCADCREMDGCYICREKRPSLNDVREMLKELLEYKKKNRNKNNK